MRTKKIPIPYIKKDPTLQPRARLDEEAIADYEAAYKAGAKLPPIDVYQIGCSRYEYCVTDGWHRLAALHRCGADEVDCHVTTGTREEAQWAAIAANQTHGLRRTTADKERAVRAALRHPMATKRRLSDRRIAEHLGVDPKTVAKYRAEMVAGEEIPHVKSRQGKDGKTYQMPDKAAHDPQVRCRCCGAVVEPDEDGDCPKCHEPEIVVTVSPAVESPAITPTTYDGTTLYLDDDSQVVGVIHGLGDKWISARGRHRVKSPKLPPRPSWEEAQADLDAYAAERGWTEYQTDQPVAVEEPPAVEQGEPLEALPNWIVDVGAIAYAAIECEGRPAVAARLQHLADEILMEDKP